MAVGEEREGKGRGRLERRKMTRRKWKRSGEGLKGDDRGREERRGMAKRKWEVRGFERRVERKEERFGFQNLVIICCKKQKQCCHIHTQSSQTTEKQVMNLPSTPHRA